MADEEVTMNTIWWFLDRHIGIVCFVVEGCLKFELSTVILDDSKILELFITKGIYQNFLDTLKEILAKNLFTQVSSKSDDYVVKEAFWAYLKNSQIYRYLFYWLSRSFPVATFPPTSFLLFKNEIVL